MEYCFYGTGDVTVCLKAEPVKGLPPLPRAGLLFGIAGELENMQWYGRGPFENYCDRKAAASVGLRGFDASKEDPADLARMKLS
jgi:beta-galactosidase